MRIEKGQTLKISGTKEYKELIENWGVIELDPEQNSSLIAWENIINFGVLRSKPNPNVVHDIGWKGVNNNEFVGSSMNPYETPKDKGIWNMGAGTMDIKAAPKTPFTSILGGAKAGESKLLLKDVTGWKINDYLDITVVDAVPDIKSSELKTPGCRWWDNDRKVYVDNFVARIERRHITAINGLTVTLNKPLDYNHLQVITEPNMLAPAGRVFMPSAINITRNVKIHGEAPGKHAHIFTCGHEYNSAGAVVAHHKQLVSVDGAEVYWMAARKFQGHPKGIADVVLGRYAMHFHHCGDGTTGSVIQNCSFHDNGGRCLVPHMANGITFKNNSITFNLGDAAWYDFQDMSHNTTYDGNMFAAILWDGGQEGGTCALLGIGDNNKFINNTLCYANQGDPDGSGAIQWTTDNESSWKAQNNIVFCSNNADWTWQNSGRPHAIEDQIAVNCNFAVTHGAYGNCYIYVRCESYNSQVKYRASGTAYGAGIYRSVMDGMGKLKETMRVMTSAVPGINYFRDCEFKNTDLGIGFDVHPHNGENATPRTIEVVNCKFINVATKYKFITPFGPAVQSGLRMLIQDGNKAESITPLNNVSSIPKFAPDKTGTGDGLRAQFYKGINFDTLVLDHVRAMVREQDWRIDLPKMPGGAHYKFILNDKISQSAFSVRYTGELEPYYTAPHRFRIHGGSGFRLWIGGKLVIDAPGNKHDNGEYVDSAWINLVSGQKTAVRVEVYEPGDRNMGVQLLWEAQNIFGLRDVEMSQLYSGTVTNIAVEPTIYKSAKMEKEFTRNNCGAGFTGGKYLFIVTAGLFTSTISQADADAKALAYLNANGQAEANSIALCTPVDPCKTFVEADYLELNPDIAAAVKDKTFSSGLAHYNKYGKNEGRRINKLCPPPKPIEFKSVEQKGENTCLDGSVIKHTVPAGKYTAATQSLADALALQELNVELAKCPLPYAEFTLKNGDKIYIFGDKQPYQIIIK